MKATIEKQSIATPNVYSELEIIHAELSPDEVKLIAKTIRSWLYTHRGKAISPEAYQEIATIEKLQQEFLTLRMQMAKEAADDQ